MKQLGTFYEAPMATLFDKNLRIVGRCMDTPNTIAYAMAKDDRVETAKTLLGYRPRAEYADRFWFVIKDFTPDTAGWRKL